MSRIVDRGAVIAAYVGVGMAITMAIAFLLVIPIEPIYLWLAFPGGMVIGYYANARSGRERGAWRRIVPNALLAGLTTGLSLAVLLLATKALFFYGDGGYPDFNRTDENGAPVGQTCTMGADCVYRRYLAIEPETLAAAGVTDAASFAEVFWAYQLSTAGFLIAMTTGAALLGGALFGVAGPRASQRAGRSAAALA